MFSNKLMAFFFYLFLNSTKERLFSHGRFSAQDNLQVQIYLRGKKAKFFFFFKLGKIDETTRSASLGIRDTMTT